MKEIIWVLVYFASIQHAEGRCPITASSSYFEITYGKDTGRGPWKKEFYECDRNVYCTNVVKTKDGKYATVNSESELNELKDVSCVWKKIMNIAACKDVRPLGMESKEISDDRITASSTWYEYTPARARLGDDYCWYPNVSDSQQYLQVDFGRATLLHALATQGRHGKKPYWVKTYLVAFSCDGKNFEAIRDSLTKAPKVFTGNTDYSSIVKSDLPVPLETRYVRILPKTHVNYIALRVEFYGCYI